MKKLNKYPLIYTLSAVFFWSTVATAFKISLEGMSFAQLLFYSSVASTLVLGIIALRQNKISSNFFSPKFILMGLINPFLYYLLLFKAYSLLPAQEAQPLNYTWPIVLSVLSVLFLKEKMTFKKVVGLISAFLGITIIATHGNIASLQFENIGGVIIAVSTSLVWATFWIINIKDKEDSIAKLFSAFFFGSVFSAIYLYFFDSFILENYNYLLGASYVGIFEMGITFFLWNKGLELSNDKTKTATFAFLSPFVSLLFIAFILGETILFSSIIGLVLIVGGIVYQNINTKQQPY
jgi:drug/metabolite transporter (DMT)-like permease